MQAALDEDIQRVFSDLSEQELLTVFVTNVQDETTSKIQATANSEVHATLVDMFGLSQREEWRLEQGKVLLGGENPIEQGDSFGDHGVEDGGRLTVLLAERPTVEGVIAELLAHHPHLNDAQLRCKGPLHLPQIEIHPKRPWCITSSWYLAGRQLTKLPDSFSNLEVMGPLILRDNELTSLPSNVGNLKLGGVLDLTANRIESLPESFSRIEFPLHNHRTGEGLIDDLPSLFGPSIGVLIGPRNPVQGSDRREFGFFVDWDDDY